MGIFDGLESLGITGFDKKKLFEDGEKAKKAAEQKKEAPKEVIEEDLIFDKTFKCPVCDRSFSAKTPRTGKFKSAGTDWDLRPLFEGIDTVKYDAITCPYCGYSSLGRYYTVNPTSGQLKLLREGLRTFNGLKAPGGVYSYDDAITRCRLSLACCVMKHAKSSEKAFTCLKLAWLLRGKRELLSSGKQVSKEEIDELKAMEEEYISNAYEGFVEAFSNENFPMCGMDETTVNLLVARLASETKDREKWDQGLRVLERIIMSKNAKSNVKEAARVTKEKIAELKEKG